MTDTRISDEIVVKACDAWEGVELPSEMPIARQEREAMRAALEAVWPESGLTFTEEERTVLMEQIRFLVEDYTLDGPTEDVLLGIHSMLGGVAA